ncbi:hypothetical protein N7471_003332 [Penicillium samsonianum]|uniref:uncharacterized protein n=1 Tax=Penicillium samsonianum TaxID=1882272 RepID=UPI00254744F0|nr:uncharacterized protein N7471_003332 [Penicillium samsonianum]KAJ6143879.1 hypothetical protein N7471_003332 [Penicillium samsonianum]
MTNGAITSTTDTEGYFIYDNTFGEPDLIRRESHESPPSIHGSKRSICAVLPTVLSFDLDYYLGITDITDTTKPILNSFSSSTSRRIIRLMFIHLLFLAIPNHNPRVLIYPLFIRRKPIRPKPAKYASSGIIRFLI